MGLLAMMAAVVEQSVDFKAQELANTAWAFAQGGELHLLLFAVLARGAERLESDFGVLELSATSWAFATAIRSGAQVQTSLFAVLAQALERHIGSSFGTLDLGTTI
eukprot:gnl/MRDRNA2_/MRDRNA2_84927_c2_seq7.p2 gnl/MRDRNA2_/MRDRNA2_84927_c2~~gnl/MRDRNA2_/MRDRNA2_84927_c2_seq7.p2  ORF type:complete len:106 (+),score=19.33 gnl/MRDRNA2_/MRDRNA2_84927_c2_seq7:321-638(+)